MESEFFLSAGIPPHPMHFEPISTSPMPNWHSPSSSMEMQADELNCSTEQSPNFIFNPGWEKSTDQSLHFESALSSMASSPAASNSNIFGESFLIRELIGKLGNISSNNSAENSSHSRPTLAAPFITSTGNNSANISCYSTPLNSPPKVNLAGMDRIQKEKLKFPSLGKSLPLNSSVAEFTADPGFARRAASFSCLGSRSFNGRTSQFGLRNPEFHNSCNPLMGNGKMPRVSSSPSLQAPGSQKRDISSPLQDRSELVNSFREESSGSEQVPNGEGCAKPSDELNSRKRKAGLKGKGKEISSNPPANPSKDAETNDDSSLKRSKLREVHGKGNENSPVKAEEEAKGNGNEKQSNANSKPPEPPKDYIHVRARRGQATDSHSLAERVRREKISERMKLLQDLVPGCNKVTGKALMLDEIINYVQSLQHQVEFLSMELASVNTSLDFNMDAFVSKDTFRSNTALSQPTFPLDSSAAAIFSHQPQHNPGLLGGISSRTVTQCSVDPLDVGLCRNFNMPLPQLDGFNQSVPQFCDDDLQKIVQMGFGQTNDRSNGFWPESENGNNIAMTDDGGTR